MYPFLVDSSCIGTPGSITGRNSGDLVQIWSLVVTFVGVVKSLVTGDDVGLKLNDGDP